MTDIVAQQAFRDMCLWLCGIVSVYTMIVMIKNINGLLITMYVFGMEL